MKKVIPVIAILGLFLAANQAQATAPDLIPVQGVLTDSAGTPVDSTVTAIFSIYTTETGGTALYTETQSVLVDDGLFTAYVGDVTTLDLTTFRDNDDLWLGIQINSDPEMERVYLGSVPFAGYAEYCGNPPAGVAIGPVSCTGTQKVTGIDASGALTCDVDVDTAYAAGTGLTLTGTTFAADVTYLQRRVTGTCATGTAISAVADDGSVTCSGGVPTGAVMFFNLTACPTGWSPLSGAQGRTLVGLPSGGTLAGTVGTAMSNLANPTHTHSVNPAAVTSSSAGGHNHRWAYHNTSESTFLYNSSGTAYFAGMNMNDGNPDPTSSPGFIMFGVGGPTIDTQTYYYTDNEAAHTHSVNVGATTSTATSHTMPYMQLLACQKD